MYKNVTLNTRKMAIRTAHRYHGLH